MTDKKNYLCEKDKCTGCAACFQGCPVSAIQMKTDEEGFRTPYINFDKCINCGKCTKICPSIQKIKRQDMSYPVAYAFKSVDQNQVRKSASGAAFAVFAKHIIKHGGTVFGTVWDDQLRAVVTKATEECELENMYGSKYVQSNTEAAFVQVKEELEKGKKVLFSGVGCQVAGLYGYLGKEYDNLYTLQIICHGAGSPGVFEDYLKKDIQKRFNSKPVWLCQTDWKNRKWNELIQRYVRFEFENGEEAQWSSADDSYLFLFLRGVLYRQVCYKCMYACQPQIGDITLGDFGGYEIAKHCEFDKTGGVSQVLVNTKKGEKLFEECKKNELFLWEERQLRECLIFNHNLWKPSSKPPFRDSFFEDRKNLSYDKLMRRYSVKNPIRKVEKLVRKTTKAILRPKGAALFLYITFLHAGVHKSVDNVLKKLKEQMKGNYDK